jgi:hypothetical protein
MNGMGGKKIDSTSGPFVNEDSIAAKPKIPKENAKYIKKKSMPDSGRGG